MIKAIYHGYFALSFSLCIFRRQSHLPTAAKPWLTLWCDGFNQDPFIKKKKKVLVLRSSQSTGGPNFIQFIQLQALGRKLTSTCRQLMRSFPSARRCSAAEATPSHTSWESGRYGWLVSSMAADVVEDFKHQCSFNFNRPLALAIKAAEWPWASTASSSPQCGAWRMGAPSMSCSEHPSPSSRGTARHPGLPRNSQGLTWSLDESF